MKYALILPPAGNHVQFKEYLLINGVVIMVYMLMVINLLWVMLPNINMGLMLAVGCMLLRLPARNIMGLICWEDS